MLILVLNRSTYWENIALIEQTRAVVDGYELRIDFLKKISLKEISHIRTICKLPIIFTWKTSLENKANLYDLVKLRPDFLDFDYRTPISVVKKVMRCSPHTKIIISIHNHTETPRHLEGLLAQMLHLPAHIYKIATFANNLLDALRMMEFMIQYSKQYNLVGICMGELGRLTRIAAPIIGSAIQYCYSGIPSATGQFSLEELLHVYFYRRIDHNTQILSLIGNPVCHSPAHYTHNWVFAHFKLSLLYVKLDLQIGELEEFCRLIKNLPFLGCSVTMPFKKAILPFLDITATIVDMTQSANTIYIKNKKLLGYNSDALGALDSIEEKIVVKNRHIIILGGGNTGKSIALEAKRRGAIVTLLNRSVEKVANFAKKLQISYGHLQNFEEVVKRGYDIICNATSLGMNGQLGLPVPSHYLLPEKYVMDVVFSREHTLFTAAADAMGCSIIYGKTMFIKQAIYQMRIWTGDRLDWITLEEIMEKRIEEYIDKPLRATNL